MQVNARRVAEMWLAALLLQLTAAQLLAQPGGRPGGPPRGRGPDAQFVEDRNDFHFLLEHHNKIRRQVTPRPDGVETVTESDDPLVAARIQKHVKAMYERVDQGRPIRRRDPLFDAIFRHADKLEMHVEMTPNGVRVTERSDDPRVVALVQAHARVVSLFVKNGFAEAQKNHSVPAEPARSEQGAGTAEQASSPQRGT